MQVTFRLDREPDRYLRLFRTYSRALDFVEKADPSGFEIFLEAVGVLRDEKGWLIVEWASAKSRDRWSRVINQSWDLESECTAIHLAPGEAYRGVADGPHDWNGEPVQLKVPMDLQVEGFAPVECVEPDPDAGDLVQFG